MRWRVLGTALAAVAFVASLACLLAGGAIALRATGLWNVPTGVLVLGASLVAAVLVFRAVHDFVVLRWSNETDPFVFGDWRPPRIL